MQANAAVYCRISKDRESEEVGVKNQEAICREIAAEHGLTVVATYVDNDRGASSRSRKTRPEYAAMIEAAGRGRFQTVIAYSMSRLTRRPSEWEDLIALASKHHIEFVYKVSPRYDLNTADGRATARTVSAWDAAEAERTGERLEFANERKTSKGIPYGRPRVFGYEPDGMTPREAEAALIRDAYAHVLRGGTMRALTAAWNAAGLTTARGNAWSGTEVRRVLIRERNAGILIVKGHEQPDSQITPIVERDTWDAVRAILTDPTRNRRGRPTGQRWLSGVMSCTCGRPMQVGTSWSGGVGSPAYACSELRRAVRTGAKREGRHAQIVAAVVEDAIAVELLATLIQEAVEGADAALPEDADVVRLRATLSRIEYDRRAVQELYLIPGADRAHLAARITALGIEHDNAQEALASALSRRSAADVVAAVREHVADILTDSPADDDARGSAIRSQWEALPVDTRRQIAAAKLSITVAPGGKGSGHGMRRVDVRPHPSEPLARVAGVAMGA